MSRRGHRSNSAADDYGMRSPHQTMCRRCDCQINDYRQAVKQRGAWIHKACAGGADDDQGNPPAKASKPPSEVPRDEWWSTPRPRRWRR